MGTFLVLAVVVICCALIIRYLYGEKKAGRSIQCGMSCAECSGHCSMPKKKGRTHRK